MPPVRVQVAGKGIVEFPEGTSPEDMQKAISQSQDSAQSWGDWAIDKAVNLLPTGGAIVGGIAGSAAGPAGTIGGAALGAAGGEAWKQNINRLRGKEAPQTAGEAAIDITKQGATAGAVTAGGEALMAAKPLLAKPAELMLDAALKKLGLDKEAIDLAATRLRLQAARSATRQATMRNALPYANQEEAIGWIDAIAKSGEKLSDWDSKFIESVGAQSKAGVRLSGNQANVLRRIHQQAIANAAIR